MKNIKITEKTTLYISIGTLLSIICVTGYTTREYSNIKNDIRSSNLQITQLNDKMLLEFARRDNIMLEHEKSRSIHIDNIMLEHEKSRIIQIDNIMLEHEKSRSIHIAKLQEYIISISNNSLKLKQLKEDIEDIKQDIKTLK